MMNPMFNPQPNYSGVTIQIANPAVNVASPVCGDAEHCGMLSQRPCEVINPHAQYGIIQSGVPSNPKIIGNTGFPAYVSDEYSLYPQAYNSQQAGDKTRIVSGYPYTNNYGGIEQARMTNPMQNTNYPNAYPAQYYLNNYNYGVSGDGNGGINGVPVDGNTGRSNFVSDKNTKLRNSDNFIENNKSYSDSQKIPGENYNLAESPNEYYNKLSGKNTPADNDKQNYFDNSTGMNSYKMYAKANEPKDTDMTRSKNIINDIDEREAELEEEKKNTKETKIVALTDEYIKSLENYLNNPNDEIRIMASKEILTRLDEDKDRYDDAALNALLNKMMQDPSKLVRIAALSAFASQLACGNDYTVKLLHNIQSNPNADKEDVLQAADILLKMSAGVEVKNIPNPAVKDDSNQKKKV